MSESKTAPLEGRFESVEAAAQAVEHLVDAAIPAEQIDVYALDRGGNRGARVKVSESPGVKRGARMGAAIGAGFGLVAFLVMWATQSFGVSEIGSLTATHAMYYIGACAAAGVPLGAAIGMAWIGKRRLDAPNVQAESFVVVVRSQGRTEDARRVLEAAGARDLG